MKNNVDKIRAEARRLVAAYTPSCDFDTLVARLAALGRHLVWARLGRA